ncbi:MAG: hypothetical protein KatS3mg105_3710 [Gemmatales bacterium]|nr:MAG: hypothetical protein KatS3mg105_3710 [Gemmatales bacterium]
MPTDVKTSNEIPGLDPRLDALVQRLKWIMGGVVLLWVGAESLAGLGLFYSPLKEAVRNNFFFVGPLLGLTVLQLASSPNRRELATMIGVAAGLAVVLHFLKLQFPWIKEGVRDLDIPSPLVVSACQSLALASILELVSRALRKRNEERTYVLAFLLPASLIVGFTVLGPYGMALTTYFNRTTFDGYVYAADSTLGFQPSFLVGQWFDTCLPLYFVGLLVYHTSAFIYMFVYVMQLRLRPIPAMDVVPSVVLATALATPLYILFPVCGPEAIWGADPDGNRPDFYPHHPPPVEQVLQAPTASRKAYVWYGYEPERGEASTSMPSLHTVIALLSWWHARRLPIWARAIAGFWLVFTLLSTIGFGFHYLFDIVVSFPFALTVTAICIPWSAWNSSEQQAAFLWGIALTAGWLYVLRWHWDWLAYSPWLPATAISLTVVLSCSLESRVYRIAFAEASQPDG